MSPLKVSSPRDDQNSSISDMNDLKLAIGSQSERSLGGRFSLQRSSGNAVREGNTIVGSDEGSVDSMKTDEDFEKETGEMWGRAEGVKKASLQMLRSVTKRMSRGDETDQAIQKVLRNLVNDFLTSYDPEKKFEDDPNLTKGQKIEKKNQVLIYELATCLPFVKLAAGRYLVGTELRYI